MFHSLRGLRLMTCMLLLPILLVIKGNAQNSSSDSLVLSLQQVEKQFIDSNYLVLASHYNVDAQKALIEQAKRWQNPVLNTDFMIGAHGKYLNYSKNADGSYNGQYYVQLQQLILTARKRGKQIDLATTNSRLSELQLQDLLRNLRYQLHQDYYTLQHQLALMNLYKQQSLQLDKLLNGMQAQLTAGNIAQKDFVRIQGLVIALQQDMTDQNKAILDTQNDLKTLLQVKDARIFIKPAEALNGEIQLPESLENLTVTALQSNPNYLLQQVQTVYQQQNLVYQKALRTPDITLGPNFDRNSNFAPNYIGMGISLPLPVFNKNQGNIKSAGFSVKQQQATVQNTETELINNVTNAYKKLLLTIEQNNSAQTDFYSKYQAIYNNMLQSYRDRQISLLEFIDFFNEYTDSQQRLMQQQLNLQLAKEELQYHVSK